MDAEPHELVVREFLKQKPEYVTETSWRDVDGRNELCMSTDMLIAFTDWTIATGRGTKSKAIKFRQWLRNRYGR